MIDHQTPTEITVIQDVHESYYTCKSLSQLYFHCVKQLIASGKYQLANIIITAVRLMLSSVNSLHPEVLVAMIEAIR